MLKKYRIVVLESPYDSWESQFTQEIFAKTVDLKLRGYKAEYPYGVLPVDTTEFVATHHIVCEETAFGLKPLMAYKSVTLEKMIIHNLPFPILNLAKNLGLSGHVASIEQIMSRCESKSLRLSYDSSWTIDPSTRENRPVTEELRSIMTALHSLYHHEMKTDEIISLGSLRFKMERLFFYWGYKSIALNGETLPEFVVPSYFNERVLMFHQQGGFSKESLQDAQKHIKLWQDRITIEPTFIPKTDKKAA